MKSLVLTPKILSLISEFALTLYRLNRSLLDVDSDDVLTMMYEHAKETQNRQLILIYLHIRAEVSNCLQKNICNGHTVPREHYQAVHH